MSKLEISPCAKVLALKILNSYDGDPDNSHGLVEILNGDQKFGGTVTSLTGTEVYFVEDE